MFGTVELPVWLFVLVLLFAAVTFASHFLFPSVRWFFRRRMERAVAELNKRLERPIEPFKLARRADTIQRLVYDRDVLAAVAEHAEAQGIPEAVAHERARRYAREIVPAFSASAYFGFAARAARWLSKALFHVRIAHYDDALEALDPQATVVFVMNHRSNMDYVLVTYLVSRRGALSYAVGEWARTWPLGMLIRAMGAYFIRRRSSDPLYRKVLARYIAMATSAGVTQAVFPEGGLSLDGRLHPPKLGILSYLVAGAEEAGRDIVFVPVGLNYDRVLEDRILIDAGRAGERRFRASVRASFVAVARVFWLKLRRRFRRFGTAAVGFGAPLSLRAFRAGRPGEPVAALGEELMRRVAAVVPALPVPLVAAEILAAAGPVGRPEIEAGVAARLNRIGRGDGAAEAVRAGLDLLLLRRLVVEEPSGIRPAPGEADTLRFYAASVAHLGNAPAASPRRKSARRALSET